MICLSLALRSFWDEVVTKLKKDYQVGSEDKGDVVFTGQRIRKQGSPIVLDQDKAIEELSEIQFDKTLTDTMTCPPSLHTEYRSVLGALNWLQSRTQYAAAYKFSRAASNETYMAPPQLTSTLSGPREVSIAMFCETT